MISSSHWPKIWLKTKIKSKALLKPKLRRKNQRMPRRTLRKTRRMPSQQRRTTKRRMPRPRKRKSQRMKSQWTLLPSKLTPLLLLMPPKTLSHKPQFNTTKFSPKRITKKRSRLSHSKLTLWDQWSKTKSHLSRMPPSKLRRTEMTERWAALVNDVLQTL